MMKSKLLFYAICGAFALAPVFVSCDKDDDEVNSNNNSSNQTTGQNNNSQGENSENTEKQEENNNTLKAVDLGLSVKWANVNVGTVAPYLTGSYFAWGETEKKESYSQSSYKYWKESGIENLYNNYGSLSIEKGAYKAGYTKYCTDPYYSKSEVPSESGSGYVSVWVSYGSCGYDGSRADWKNTLDSEDDAATVNLGSHWRTPTKEEWKELINNCTRVWCEMEGVKGYKVTGQNGNYIFLPVTGYRSEDNKESIDQGYYWASTIEFSKNYNVDDYYYSCYKADGILLGYDNSATVKEKFTPNWSYTRSYGFAVRAVYIE